MIYRFRSKAGADVVMLGANGKQVLELLGREPLAEGLIEPEHLAAAMERLQQAVLADEAAFAARVAEAEAAGEPPPRRDGVQLRQRVWPLVELMRHSQRENVDLLWSAR